MVLACFMSVQRQCSPASYIESQDAAAAAAAEESLQGRRIYCRAGNFTAEAEKLMHLMRAGDVPLIKVLVEFMKSGNTRHEDASIS